MRYWIRFEDLYGVYSIYTKLNRVQDIKLRAGKINYNYLNSDVTLVCGLGANCKKCTKDEEKAIVKFNPDYIITVIDLDASQNNGTCTLSHKEALKHFTNLENRLRKHNSLIEFRYVPTIFAAETIMLYQYFTRKDKEHFCIEDIVHPINTWKFQSIMLAILSASNHVMDTKKMHEYCVPNTLARNLEEAYKLGETRNISIIDFLLHNKIGLELTDFITVLKDEELNFSARKARKVDFTIQGIPVDSHTSLFARKHEFKNFPASYR